MIGIMLCVCVFVFRKKCFDLTKLHTIINNFVFKQWPIFEQWHLMPKEKNEKKNSTNYCAMAIVKVDCFKKKKKS